MTNALATKSIASALLAASLLALGAGNAIAQGDGPRVYFNVPAGTQVLSLYGVFNRGNQLPDPGSVVERGDIDVNVAVALYTYPIAIAGRAGGVFAIATAGEVEGTAELREGSRLVGRSSGLADLKLGVVQNLVGSPSLPGKEYASFEPGFSLGVLGMVTTPTGDYSPSKVVNLGANRWALRLGAPIAWYVGKSYRDPKLTTFELLPSVTFYGDNDDPFGADRREQAPILVLEGHVTRNLNRTLWVSLDGLYLRGGETTTDGVAGEDEQEAFQLGGTVNLTLSRSLSVKASYGGVVSHNDGGPDGHMVRVIATLVF